jgi:uncharacterized membrane protein YtjA (UPF0391 family)
VDVSSTRRGLAGDETAGPGILQPMALHKESTMLYYAIVFLIIALIAGFFGFFGVAGLAAGIAKILFVIFIILFIVSLIFGRRPRV